MISNTKKQSASPAPRKAPGGPPRAYESCLREICVALGWQGGTIHQVKAEIARLRAAEVQNTPKKCDTCDYSEYDSERNPCKFCYTYDRWYPKTNEPSEGMHADV